MGYVTVVFVRSDYADSIRNDPEFGKKLADALRKPGTKLHGDAVEIICHQHSGANTLVRVHGNGAQVVDDTGKTPGKRSVFG